MSLYGDLKNGNETSPYGYSLPDGAYTIEMSDFTEESSKLFFFTERSPRNAGWTEG